MLYYCTQYIYACVIINYYHCKYERLIQVIYPISFGTKEPEDEWLCKAVLILIKLYIETLDLLK